MISLVQTKAQDTTRGGSRSARPALMCGQSQNIRVSGQGILPLARYGADHIPLLIGSNWRGAGSSCLTGPRRFHHAQTGTQFLNARNRLAVQAFADAPYHSSALLNPSFDGSKTIGEDFGSAARSFVEATKARTHV